MTREQEAVGFLLSGKLEICNLHGVLYYNICRRVRWHGRFVFGSCTCRGVLCLRAKTNSMLTFLTHQQMRELLQENRQIRENYLTMLANQVHHSLNRLQQFTAPTPSIALGMYLLQHETEGLVRLTDGFAGTCPQTQYQPCDAVSLNGRAGTDTDNFSF